MSNQNAHGTRSVGFLVCTTLLAIATTGCGSPNTASIAVRKENQSLKDEIATLQRAREADAATIRSLESHASTVPSLPAARLENLFTTHGLQLGRLTGGADTDPAKPGDEALKIYATPTDDEGQPFKAAGSFTIEAFDLTLKEPQIGKWTIDTKTARQSWLGSALIHAYVLTLPWQTPPQHAELTLKITFRDELTAREFTQQRVVTVHLPTTTQTTSEAR
jgi:hypothetical protein